MKKYLPLLMVLLVLTSSLVDICSANTVKNIATCIAPTPKISSNSPVLIGKSSVIILNSSVMGLRKYNWAGPNGFKSSKQNIVVLKSTTNDQGIYSVTVTETRTLCTASTTISIQVVPCIPPSILATSNSPVTQGKSINLRARTSSLGTLAYKWLGPNGFTSTQQNTSIAIASSDMAGVYSVTVTNTKTSCSISATTLIKINPCAIPQVTATSNTPVLIGRPIALLSKGRLQSPLNPSMFSIAGLSYQWSGPNGFKSSAQNIIIPKATIANKGLYTVIATNAKSSCTASAITSVNVVSCIGPNIVATSNSPVNEGKNLELKSSVIGSFPKGTLTFQWFGPNSFTSNTQSASIASVTTDSQGVYTVVITNTKTNCPSSTTVSVEIKALPNISPIINLTALPSDIEYKVGDVVTLNATASDPDGIVAQVEFFANDISIGVVTTSPYTISDIIPVSDAGLIRSYTAKVTDNKGAITVSSPISIHILTPIEPKSNVLPVVSLSALDTSKEYQVGDILTLTAMASDPDGNIAQVEFFANDISIGVSNTEPFTIDDVLADTTPVGERSYTAKATDNQGGVSASEPVKIIVIVPANSRVGAFYAIKTEVMAAINIETYPNPAQEQVLVRVQLSEISALKLSLINAMGGELNSWQLGIGQKNYQKEIDISKYPAGIYFISATTENKQVVKKIIKN